MAELERVIDGAYAFGALAASDAGAALYRGRGWQLWEGRVEAFTPDGIVHLPEEEGASSCARRARGPTGPAAPLVFDWRDGDVT